MVFIDQATRVFVVRAGYDVGKGQQLEFLTAHDTFLSVLTFSHLPADSGTAPVSPAIFSK
jgi:hypothetical protein